jgi:hypothetical protein
MHYDDTFCQIIDSSQTEMCASLILQQNVNIKFFYLHLVTASCFYAISSHSFLFRAGFADRCQSASALVCGTIRGLELPELG